MVQTVVTVILRRPCLPCVRERDGNTPDSLYRLSFVLNRECTLLCTSHDRDVIKSLCIYIVCYLAVIARASFMAVFLLHSNYRTKYIKS